MLAMFFKNKIWLKDSFLLLFIALAISVIWFRQGVLYGGGESGLTFSNLDLTLKQSLSVWLDNYLGAPSIYQVNNLPFYFFADLLFSLGIPGWLIQAFIHFVLISVGILSMYFLVKVTIGKEIHYKYLAVFSGLFYLFNLYSMSQVWSRGLYMQFIPFASFPLMLLLLNWGLEKTKLVFILLLLIVSFIFSAGFTPAYVLSFWLMITFVFGYYLFIYRSNFQKLKNLIILFFVLLIGWVLVHSWWLIQYMLLGNSLFLGNELITNEGMGTLISVSKYSPFLSVIRLVQDGYFNNPLLFGNFYQTIFFQILSWITPVLAVLSWNKFKKSKWLKFYLGIFLFSLFICLGAGFPLGFLFVFLFEHFPILHLFRNPYEKFGIVLLISYTPLIAIGFFRFSEIISIRFKRLGKYLMGLILVVLFIILVWPMWTGLVITTKNNVNFVNVPNYYRDFKEWLRQNNKERNRIFMLPFMPGSGVTLNWGGKIYSGVDPSTNFLDYSIISWVQDFPYTKVLLGEIYKDINKYPVSSMLGLLRAKYLVVRDDVSGADKRDFGQEESFLQRIYVPNDTNDKMTVSCQDQSSTSYQGSHLTLVCQIPADFSNWSEYRYLHLLVKTDQPAALDLSIRDINHHRPRWVYTSNSTDYQTSSSDWTPLMLDINLPVYGDKDFDISKAISFEISADQHLLNGLPTAPSRIDLKAIYLDKSQEIKVDNYLYINQFDKLRLYQLKKYRDFPDITILSAIKKVNQFSDMFKDAENLSVIDGQIGYVIKSQNEKFNYPDSIAAQHLVLKKNSEYQYLAEIKGQGSKYLVLHTSFKRWWKVIPNVSEDTLEGTIFSEIALLKRTTLDEHNHFVVNGYANLWKIDGQNVNYAIVFLPQIITNILLKVSLFVVGTIGITIIILIIKKSYFRSNKIHS